MNISTMASEKIKKAKTAIVIASIAIPIIVAILFKVKIPGIDLTFLPPIYATINAITACFLLVALIAIKFKKIKLHEAFIKICMILSLLFLGCYVAYHMTSDSTIYGDLDKNGIRSLEELKLITSSLGMYQFILLSHILLSIVIVPIVLFTYLFAWQGNFERHKKWTRFTWPLWFYVAVTGVIVFIMISPYYK